VLARSVSLNALGQAASLAIGFVASVILARVLGPADRGLLAIMTSAVEIGLVVVGAGMPIAISYYAGRPGTRPGALTGNSLVYVVLVALVVIPLTWLLHDQLASLLGQGRGGRTWVLASVLVPLTLLQWTVINQLVGTLRFGRYNALVVGSTAINLIGVVVLVGLLELGVAGALTAGIVSVAVSVGAGLTMVLRRTRPTVDGRLFRRVVSYGARVQVGAMFQYAVTRVDILILQLFVPLKEVGYYAVAQVLAELPMALALAFKTSVLPLIARAELEDRAATTAISVRNFGIVAALAIVGNVVFAVAVIVFAYGDAFLPAIVPTLILLPGVWFLGLGTVIAGDLQGRGKPGLTSRLAGGAAVATIALDFALIPPLGVVGAALASVAVYALFGIASAVVLRRVSGVSFRAMFVPRRSDFERYRHALAAAGRRARR
jgi:O-antigen/teichoic acid export membrane protein